MESKLKKIPVAYVNACKTAIEKNQGFIDFFKSFQDQLKPVLLMNFY